MINETSTQSPKNNVSCGLNKCYSIAALDTTEGRMYMRGLTMRVLCEMRLEETIREVVNTP